MKKFLTVFLAALLALAIFAGCAPAAAEPSNSPADASAAPTEAPAASPAGDSSLADIKAKGTLVLGMDDAFPPMGFRDEKTNELTGFDLDVATEACKRMGVTLVPTPIDWTQKILELDSGNIDVIWNGFSIDAERLEKTAMTFPYMKNRQILVVLADSPYQTLADLAGKKLSLQADSTAETALEDSPDFKASLSDVVLLSDNMKALMDLEAKGCDAVLMDEIVANYYITSNGSPFRVLDESLADEEYGIGCRKGSETLKAEIERILLEMASDGTLAEISTKWFGKDVTIVGK
ncbi:MAG: amino acid ABC transporter substrate-binding protein [Bacillota bacterium]